MWLISRVWEFASSNRGIEGCGRLTLKIPRYPPGQGSEAVARSRRRAFKRAGGEDYCGEPGRALRYIKVTD